MSKNFREFERQIKKLRRDVASKTERASGDATAGELFNGRFMRRYTDFESFEAMVEAGGWGPPTAETFRAIPDEEWESWVRTHTRFSSWVQMQQKAGAELVAKRMREP